MEIDNKEVIKRVNEFIKEKKISKSKFSKEIGFSKSYICNILGEKISINDTSLDRILIAICYKYGLSMQWLKTGDGEVYSSKNIDKEYIISSLDKLDIFSQRFLLMIIEVLLLYPNIIKKHDTLNSYLFKDKPK